MATKLTRDLLISLGFIGQGKSITGSPLYRLEWRKNHYMLQVELGDYPQRNPNSGIVSIYYRELKDEHVHTWESKEKTPTLNKRKKIDFVLASDEKASYGIKYMTFPEREYPIAWNVTTLERLNDIYTSLTRMKPLKPYVIKAAKKQK